MWMHPSTRQLCFIIGFTCCCWVSVDAAFGIPPVAPPAMMARRCCGAVRCTALDMKKRNLRNKQADLARKMELAKQQNRSPAEDSTSKSTTREDPPLSDADIKQRNDRRRFEELLQRESASVLNAYSKDGYLTREQEEEEINAARTGVERLFEGDPAPSEPFEELVSIKTENAIGKGGASRLVPWLRKKNIDRQDEFVIVLTDPRMKSVELRQTIKTLRTELSPELLKRMIVINADSPAENRRWLKKNGIMMLEEEHQNNNNNIMDVYSDEKMEWMRAYTALGETRFSMCMFILADGRVQKLAREVDGMDAGRVIQNAVKTLDRSSYC